MGTRCSRCEQEKTLKHFGKTSAGHTMQECKQCVKDRKLNRVPQLAGFAAAIRKWSTCKW